MKYKIKSIAYGLCIQCKNPMGIVMEVSPKEVASFILTGTLALLTPELCTCDECKEVNQQDSFGA